MRSSELEHRPGRAVAEACGSQTIRSLTLRGTDKAARAQTKRGATAREGTMVVSIDHADIGLMVGRAEGIGNISEAKTDPLHGFELSGNDNIWRETKAIIQGDAVIVTSEQVAAPVAVRYACPPHAAKGQPWNLYNKHALPASPFCCDWKRMPYDPARNPMRR
ncbi:MAG: hypothetical protein WD768_14460 [Phycisphaeraceae bacterium]